MPPMKSTQFETASTTISSELKAASTTTIRTITIGIRADTAEIWPNRGHIVVKPPLYLDNINARDANCKCLRQY